MTWCSQPKELLRIPISVLQRKSVEKLHFEVKEGLRDLCHDVKYQKKMERINKNIAQSSSTARRTDLCNVGMKGKCEVIGQMLGKMFLLMARRDGYFKKGWMHLKKVLPGPNLQRTFQIGLGQKSP